MNAKIEKIQFDVAKARALLGSMGCLLDELSGDNWMEGAERLILLSEVLDERLEMIEESAFSLEHDEIVVDVFRAAKDAEGRNLE